MSERRKGTRCSVCTFCGRCFEHSDGSQQEAWTGERCEVCVECGKCLRRWGVVSDDPDAMSGPTNWADAFKAMDDGSSGTPPPIAGAPGSTRDVDARTGATPGVATACKELGLNDMESLASQLGIKLPGEL